MLHYEDFHVEVRVIGSNTHSVLNCLSLWIGCHVAAMLAWARETSHPAPEDSWQKWRDPSTSVTSSGRLGVAPSGAMSHCDFGATRLPCRSITPQPSTRVGGGALAFMRRRAKFSLGILEG